MKKIRLDLGFKSGKAFYSYLESKTRISFNYSYYTKIESGKTIPSYSVINEISVQLDKKLGRQLIASYCRTLFPNYLEVFKETTIEKNLKEPFNNKIVNKNEVTIKQNELTFRQVIKLSETFEHYIVFVILSLSRVSLSLKYLDDFLSLSSKSYLEELKEVGIIEFDGTQAKFSALEQKFPSILENKELAQIYSKLDDWDQSIQKFLNFNERKKKFFIRRTSKKHVTLLNGILNQLDYIVKISDEIDPNLNDEVMVIEYKLAEGKMPG